MILQNSLHVFSPEFHQSRRTTHFWAFRTLGFGALDGSLYDGIEIGRLIENGLTVFELPSDADIMIEIVVKLKSGSAAEPNPKPASDS